jgi:hypothetical protein
LVALRGLLDKRPPDEVLEALGGYDSAERPLLRDVLRVAARLSDQDLANASPQEVAAALDDVEALLRELRPRAALVFGRLCFCRAGSVANFGAFEPLQDGHVFTAPAPGHRGEPVQVYAELRNFTSRPVGDQFETVLKGTLTIDGKPLLDGRGGSAIVTHLIPPATGRSRTPRHDLFVNIHFDTPKLPPGFYTLWVEVEDVTPRPEGSRVTCRVARRSLDFTIVGDTPPVGLSSAGAQ